MPRELGVWLGSFIVVNATIGTGIFKTPAKVARLAGSIEAYLGVWITGGLIALCGALTIAELAAALPRTGGIYEYLRRAYGPTAAFLFGWTTLTLLIPSAVGSFARLASEAIVALLGVESSRTIESAIAIALIAVCAAANLTRVDNTVRGQSMIAAAKYTGVLVLALAGLLLPIAAGFEVPVPDPPLPTNTGFTIGGFATALVSVMWAYDGWADLSRVSGEVRDPEKTLPRALVIGTAAILFVYLAANLGYVRAIGLTGLQHSTTGMNIPAANVATATMGPIGYRVLTTLVIVSCVGCCMTTLLTAPRVFVAMATDGLFPKAIGAVTERGVPGRAIAITALVGALYVTFRSFEQLTDAFVAGFFPFYMAAVIAVPVLRRREPDLARPFRVPLYPVVPIVFLIGAGALLIGSLLDADRTAVLAFAIMFAGWPLFRLWLAVRPKA